MHYIDKQAGMACGAAVAALLLGTIAPHSASAQERTPAQSIAAAYNSSGQQLSRRLSATANNLVFSPYSVGTAMAMTLAGARGDTEQEMAKVLRQSLAREQMGRASGSLQALLTSYDRSDKPPNCPPNTKFTGKRCEGPLNANQNCFAGYTREGDRCVIAPNFPPSAKLATANALMIPKGGATVISQDYSALLARQFDAGLFQNVSLEDVNAWVSRRTEGKIDRILDQLDPNAAAVILNAIYFKAAWQYVFSRQNTRNEPFHLTRGQRVAVPTMQNTERLRVVARPGYRAIKLPYSVNALNMIVVLPNEIDGIQQVSARLDAAEFSQLHSSLRSANPRSVELALPLFKIATKTDLIKHFQQMGMRLPFGARADFSGMTGPNRSPLSISVIEHAAVIEVTEEGTEAAAATAVVLAPGAGAPQKPEPFRVDRPFLFFIVDDASGAILFQGRLLDPR
jgi:serpin B